jgi:hypothetical protein
LVLTVPFWTVINDMLLAPLLLLLLPLLLS